VPHPAVGFEQDVNAFVRAKRADEDQVAVLGREKLRPGVAAAKS